MSVKENVAQLLEDLSESELQQAAEYLDFLKFQARKRARPPVDVAQFASLYGEFAEEDRCLAEEGMAEYSNGLLTEDSR